MDTPDPNALIFAIRDRGKVISMPHTDDMIVELDGKHYHYYVTHVNDRRPGEGPWRVEEIEKP